VIWKRNFKRNSSHYLGEDIDFNTAHWTIVGDHLRFILVIAYKQNPRTHSRILVFGDIVDVNDDKLKTILVGYTNDQMGMSDSIRFSSTRFIVSVIKAFFNSVSKAINPLESGGSIQIQPEKWITYAELETADSTNTRFHIH